MKQNECISLINLNKCVHIENVVLPKYYFTLRTKHLIVKVIHKNSLVPD